MQVDKKVFIFFVVLLSSFCLSAADIYASIKVAANCSYAGVSSAISSSNSGDTVSVPGGDCTWNTPLVISKGITLRGAGAGNTVIKGNVGSSNYMITYRPSNPASDEPFRLTGFTIDCNTNSKGVALVNLTTTPAVNIRVDHNRFINPVSYGYEVFEIEGTVYGVADNNTFQGASVAKVYGDGTSAWSRLTFSYGSANNFYFENNIFNLTVSAGAIGGGAGGRYVARYNTVNYTGTGRLAPWFDSHGNQYNANPAMMGVEVYGNVLNDPNNKGVRLIQDRGGKALVFDNVIFDTNSSSNDLQAVEEYADEMTPPANAPDGEPQHVNDTYYWNNRTDNRGVQTIINGTYGTNCCSTSAAWQPNHDYNSIFYCVHITDRAAGGKCFRVWTSGTSGSSEPVWNEVIGSGEPNGLTNDGTVQWVYMNEGNALTENVDFYNQNASFDGASGIGCGPLFARPKTCTTGVGYWATDQSCSSVEDVNVGVDPATPISGTLYKCTSTNTWTAYYTPYQYPHPLTWTPQNLAASSP